MLSRRLWELTLALLLACLSLSTPAKEWVPKNKLDCASDFPCPAEIQRRVDFWIQVFSQWDGDDIVLHDAESPWRVYEVLPGAKSCSSSKAKKRRLQISKALTSLAANLKKDYPPKGSLQKALAQQISPLNSKNVFAAKENLRCQGGVKNQFTSALTRFSQYKGLVSKLIADSGMSPEFLYLPFVESSYRPDAYSKVGAAGMWQIMPATARNLGLEINATVDERLDPEAATRGAMRYFKEAQTKLTKAAKTHKKNVSEEALAPFIVTSYNYGINGMRRAINEVGPDFYKVLREYRSPSFRVAVKNFYASFLAARHLARNADDYFGNVKKLPPSEKNTIVLVHDTSIERIKYHFGLSEKELKHRNASLTRFVWNNWRLIPAGTRLHLPSKKGGWADDLAALNALPPEDSAKDKVIYRVRRGDTACAIARAFEVKCSELIAANSLGRRGVIRIGQRLNVPGRFVHSQAAMASEKAVEKMTRHTVRRGDTACKIAEQYEMSCKALIALNGLNKRATVKLGQRLKVKSKSMVDAASVTLAKDGSYSVKKGDSACQIAERFSVSCKQLISVNRLGRRAAIKVGQALKIPGVASERIKQVASGGSGAQGYAVVKGDTACAIAAAFDVPCSQLIKANDLGRKAKIKVGQQLTIPGTETAQIALLDDRPSVTLAAGESPLTDSIKSLVDQLPDLKLKSVKRGSKTYWQATVLAEETIGHYADWLRVGRSITINRLNGFRVGHEIQPGDKLLLAAQSGVDTQQFETRRSEYHQVLLEELKEHYQLVGTKQVKVGSGQTLWSIANDASAPMWLVLRLNPELVRSLRAGQTVVVPVLHEHQG